MKDAENGPRPANVFFRLSLWLVERASRLVPWDRREDWRCVTMAASVVVIVVVALGAALVPARRASRVDPVESLR